MTSVLVKRKASELDDGGRSRRLRSDKTVVLVVPEQEKIVQLFQKTHTCPVDQFELCTSAEDGRRFLKTIDRCKYDTRIVAKTLYAHAEEHAYTCNHPSGSKLCYAQTLYILHRLHEKEQWLPSIQQTLKDALFGIRKVYSYSISRAESILKKGAEEDKSLAEDLDVRQLILKESISERFYRFYQTAREWHPSPDKPIAFVEYLGGCFSYSRRAMGAHAFMQQLNNKITKGSFSNGSSSHWMWLECQERMPFVQYLSASSSAVTKTTARQQLISGLIGYYTSPALAHIKPACTPLRLIEELFELDKGRDEAADRLELARQVYRHLRHRLRLDPTVLLPALTQHCLEFTSQGAIDDWMNSWARYCIYRQVRQKHWTDLKHEMHELVVAVRNTARTATDASTCLLPPVLLDVVLEYVF